MPESAPATESAPVTQCESAPVLEKIECRAREIVQDELPFVVGQEGLVGRNVTAALLEHGNNYPAESAPVIESTGERIQDMPDEYVPRFSTIKKIEHPTVENGGDGKGIDERLWLKIRHGGRDKILFQNPPKIGEQYAVHLSIPHTVDPTALAEHEHEALAYLAASHVAKSLASRTAQGLEFSIPAEAVDFGDKPAVFNSLSKAWKETYKSIMTAGRLDSTDPATPDTSTGFTTWNTPRRFGARRLFGRTDP